MKIGLLTQEYHTGENRFGGVGRAFGKIANWLAGHGHDVTVYMQSRQSDTIEERPGLRLVLVAPRSMIHWRWRSLVAKMPAFVRGWIWHFEVDSALSEKIMQDYRDGRIEVLLTNRGVTAPRLMIDRRLPTVVRMQYSFLRKQRLERLPVTLLHRYHEGVERRAIRRADAVYAPSTFTRNYARSFASRDIDVIRTPMFELQPSVGWETVKQQYQLPASYYLYWGGMVRVKGVHILAEALPRVLEADQERHVVIVGSRENRDSRGNTLTDLILSKSAKHPDRILILPPLDQPELFAVIKQAHVVVLPSIMDNLPNTLLEAMYFGKVIVASRGASLDEMIEHEKEGLLVPPADPDALAEGMLRAASLSESERKALGAAAAAKVRALCSPDEVMPQVVHLCETAIDRYGRATKTT